MRCDPLILEIDDALHLQCPMLPQVRFAARGFDNFREQLVEVDIRLAGGGCRALQLHISVRLFDQQRGDLSRVIAPKAQLVRRRRRRWNRICVRLVRLRQRIRRLTGHDRDELAAADGDAHGEA